MEKSAKKGFFTPRKMVQDALLAAMYVALRFFVIKTGFFELTFDAFPIIIGAVMLGPGHGALIGLLGSFIDQVFFSGYGITPTTPLWMLPDILRGLVIGAYSAHCGYNMSRKQMIMICVVSAFMVTGLNTLALFVDSKIYGYYSYTMVFGMLIPKLIWGGVLGCVFALVVPPVVKKLRSNIKL